MKKCINLSIGTTTIKKEPDYDADSSYLGEYGDKLKPGCIIRYDKEFYEDIIDNEDYEVVKLNREYSFFYPPDNGEKIGTPDYKKYALQDYQNMEDLNNSQWGYIGITIKTEIVANIPNPKDKTKYTEMSDKIISSLYGIEDHWNKDNNDYIKTVIEDLKEEQKDQLLKMGFSEEEIKESFDNAEEVDL